MKRSNRLVLLIGVFLAVVAFVGIAITLNSGSNGTGGTGAATPPPTLPTVVAVQDIPLGTRITDAMLTVVDKKVDTERLQDAFGDKSQVIGKIARQQIGNGAQVTASDFSTASTGCSQIDVPAGFVAIAVQVDQVSGVGTVINSGDYVDMVVGFTGDKFPVVTLNPTDKSITVVSGLNGTSVKLLLEGMQVLCRQLPPPTTAANNGQPAASGAPDNGNPQTSLTGQQEIVILGVKAAQAEVIKFAQLDGSISLVLRSVADFTDPTTGAPITPAPEGTTGITLKKLTTDFAVPIPELVEAILPAQAKP
ncbi:MAG TPA: Flp pilus assembly protein CpaB [Candidatus Limnocylindrales bacterium]|nr:Flp pilus assembly protein CpaB [Candidatus Limnocylindrales bacterium]